MNYVCIPLGLLRSGLLKQNSSSYCSYWRFWYQSIDSWSVSGTYKFLAQMLSICCQYSDHLMSSITFSSIQVKWWDHWVIPSYCQQQTKSLEAKQFTWLYQCNLHLQTSKKLSPSKARSRLRTPILDKLVHPNWISSPKSSFIKHACIQNNCSPLLIGGSNF